MSKRILIVDDEIDLSELLSYNLQRAGYDTRLAHDGRAGLEAVESFGPDLVILDVMMPEMSGTEVAQRLRRDARTAHLPVIMLTARSGEADELSGLSSGADDYIIKPYSMRVVEARIEALLRRMGSGTAGGGAQTAPAAGHRFGPLSVDTDTHEVRLDGEPMRLTVTEFRLLEALISAGERVMSRKTLIARALGPGVTVTERTIDVHVTSIRKKMGDRAGMIRTVRGVGYRLSTDASARGLGE